MAEEGKPASEIVAHVESLLPKVRASVVVIPTPFVFSMVALVVEVLIIVDGCKDGTLDIAKAVSEVKAGRVEYRTDSFGNIHGVIGKASFSEEDLLANLDAFVAQILRIKPATVKGEYVKNISISSTMGPGIKVENSFDK